MKKADKSIVAQLTGGDKPSVFPTSMTYSEVINNEPYKANYGVNKKQELKRPATQMEMTSNRNFIMS